MIDICSPTSGCVAYVSTSSSRGNILQLPHVHGFVSMVIVEGNLFSSKEITLPRLAGTVLETNDTFKIYAVYHFCSAVCAC